MQPRRAPLRPRALPANLGPVLEFMRALWALDHALAVRHREISRQFGVTGSQRLVVRIVGQTPGVSAGQVARVLHVHPSTLTPTLQALVKDKLLQRAPDAGDRRRSVLWLTRRGERVDGASAQLVDKAVRRALAQLSGSEVFAARRVLHAVAAAVGGEIAPRRALDAADRRRAGEGRRPRRIPARETDVSAPAVEREAVRPAADRAASGREQRQPSAGRRGVARAG